MSTKLTCDVCGRDIVRNHYSIDSVSYEENPSSYSHWARHKGSVAREGQVKSWTDYTDLHFHLACWESGKVDIAAIIKQRQEEFERLEP